MIKDRLKTEFLVDQCSNFGKIIIYWSPIQLGVRTTINGMEKKLKWVLDKQNLFFLSPYQRIWQKNEIPGNVLAIHLLNLCTISDFCNGYPETLPGIESIIRKKFSFANYSY